MANHCSIGWVDYRSVLAIYIASESRVSNGPQRERLTLRHELLALDKLGSGRIHRKNKQAVHAWIIENGIEIGTDVVPCEEANRIIGAGKVGHNLRARIRSIVNHDVAPRRIWR